MFKFLFGLILFFVLLFLLAGALGIGFLRSIFGSSKRSARQQNETIHTSQGSDKDKIFGDHEGEYVEFEEIEDTPESPEADK